MMKDEIIIRTLMDTEISVLEEFVKKVEDSPKVLEDDKFVSRANFDILKGHLGTLKKLRETSWKAIKMDEVHNKTTVTMSNGEKVEWSVPKYFAGIPGRDDDPCPIPDMPQINWQTNTDQRTCCATVLKTENYPGQFENLVKGRDNWREMYNEELKKNGELHKKLSWNEEMLSSRYSDIERLKKENNELSRINSARGDELDRLRQRGTGLELENDELKTKLSLNEEMLSNRYSDIERLKKENDELKRKVTEFENRVVNIKNENSELSRINSARLGDINRLQDKVDKLDGYLHSIDDAYSEMPVNKLRPGYYDGMVKFCNDVFDILDDWKKLLRMGESNDDTNAGGC